MIFENKTSKTIGHTHHSMTGNPFPVTIMIISYTTSQILLNHDLNYELLQKKFRQEFQSKDLPSIGSSKCIITSIIHWHTLYVSCTTVLPRQKRTHFFFKKMYLKMVGQMKVFAEIKD